MDSPTAAAAEECGPWRLPLPSVIYHKLPVRVRWRLAWAAARAASRPERSRHHVGECSRVLALVPFDFMKAEDLTLRAGLADLADQLDHLPAPGLAGLRYTVKLVLRRFDEAPPWTDLGPLRRFLQEQKGRDLSAKGVRDMLATVGALLPAQGATP